MFRYPSVVHRIHTLLCVTYTGLAIDFLLGASAILGGRDLSLPLKILSDHWVENVGDLRLIVQEGLLRGIGLPIRLCVWIEDELARVANTNGVNGNNGAIGMNGSAVVSSPHGNGIGINGAFDMEQKKRFKGGDEGKGVLFKYVSDFDANGILYWLGTAGGTRPWLNPGDAQSVTVTTSGLMADSVPVNALVGRDTLRLVTASEPGAYFAIDLHDNFVYPTHYSLKHYISWDTECVRDWRLEGSVDRTTWVVLRDHKGDSGINGKGGTKTWAIPMGDEPTIEQLAAGRVPSPHLCFCMFRIYMTGPNSNGHLYLACSGFEIYGLLHAGARPTSQSLSSLIASSIASPFAPMSIPPSVAAAVPSVITPVGVAEHRPSLLQQPSLYARQEGNEGGAAQAVNGAVPAAQQPRATIPMDVREFKHSSDFDGNGILYYLGTRGGQQAWSNPADQGFVMITSSSLMGDSAPINSFCGAEVVRCVTRPQPDSWFAIDFKDKTIRVTGYTLRHYSSWDAEAVRNWRFEGSLTGDRWVVLSSHENDESLNAKGATKTWFIPDSPVARQPYRYFRIFQTGENSNKHHYLAISGFEIYGAIYSSDGTTPLLPLSAAAPLPLPSISSSLAFESKAAQAAPSFSVVGSGLIEFKHTADFDGRGIIHYMATDGLTRAWRNPAEASPQIVRVLPSTLAPDSTPSSAVVGQDVVRCVTKSEPKSWFVIDLITVAVRPSAYTLRHYISWDTEAVRNWVFQGSIDGETWTTLREHVEDTGLEGKGSTKTWPIIDAPIGQYYRQFRIFQTGPNSNKHHYLAVSGFELYGTAKMPDTGVLARAHERTSSLLVIPPGDMKGLAAAAIATAAASGGAEVKYGSSGDKVELSWDDDNRAPSLQLTPNAYTVRNNGSADKWQLVRSLQSWDRGRVGVQVRVVKEPKTTNTWRFIVGVIPSTVDCKGAKQWVGTGGSWGYIGGTGGKCHMQPKSLTYGAKYTQGDVVGIIMDFDKGTIEYFKNHVSQGIAFDNLTGRCHIAASLTAADSALSIHHWDLRANEEKDIGTAGWDAEKKSQFLDVDAKNASIVTNTGSSDKWQSVRSLQMFGVAETSPIGASGKQYFEVEIISNPQTPNSWQFIVGAVPATFTCSGTKQWVGASKSWGYIAGTGGKCYDTPATMTYGEKYGFGDVIGCQLDWDAKTIEFFKNGVSQGVAFTSLTSPAYAAVSLTGTGASARLRIRKL